MHPFRTATWAVVALAAGLVAEVAHAEQVRVGYAGSSPFVVDGEHGPTGAAIEIWRAVADELDLDYTLVRMDTVDALVDATSTGTIAIGIGPISITSARAGRVDFTQPYFEARLGLLAKAGTGDLGSRIRPFLSRAFIVALGTLLLLLFGVGNLLWYVERKNNPEHFPAAYRAGVREGMWFALVTMTTVGYGDRVPVSAAGRLIAGVWMIVSMIAASSITAGIATALTLSTLDSPKPELDDLGRKKVAVVRGTTALRTARRYQARVSEWPSRDEAIAAVESGEVDAMLFDSPALQDWLNKHAASELVLTELPVAAVDYGFALPPGSPLRRRVDRVLLLLWERQRIQAEIEVWLPAVPSD